jgi:cytochrome c553
MPAVTLTQIADWRRTLREEGDGEFLDPTLAQIIAPKLMDEVERLHAELARARRQLAAEEAAALVEDGIDAAAHGSECGSCHNAEGRAALARLRKIAGA